MIQSEQIHMHVQDSQEENRNYKDCLIRIVFRNKKDLLELYNAINGSDYKNPEELTVYTLEDVVFMGIKNDISFLMGEMLNLYEHQSTKNPNMPIRGLMYFARNYASYIAGNNLDIYGTTLQKLPFPQYYVLYNGSQEEEDRCEIELKDAFPVIEGMEPCLKCTATLLNVNYGHNRELMERCRALHDYAVYVQRVRENQAKGMVLPEAVDKATDDCIRDEILKDILLKNRAEVKNMVLGTWGTENHLRAVKAEREQNEREIKELVRKRNKLEQEKAELEQEKTELEQEKTELEQEKTELEQENAFLKRKKDAEDRLTMALLGAGKSEILKIVLEDEEYRLRLLRQYGLFDNI